ncbi:MAG: hypothetical protein V8S89_02305 [Oscillospiraceae bacterium]
MQAEDPIAAYRRRLPNCRGFRYAITSNGAAIHRLPDESVRRSAFCQAAVEVILAETAHFPVLLEAYISGVAYTEARYFEDPVRWGNPYPAYIWNTRKPVADMRFFLQQHCRELDGICLRLCAVWIRQ